MNDPNKLCDAALHVVFRRAGIVPRIGRQQPQPWRTNRQILEFMNMMFGYAIQKSSELNPIQRTVGIQSVEQMLFPTVKKLVYRRAGKRTRQVVVSHSYTPTLAKRAFSVGTVLLISPRTQLRNPEGGPIDVGESTGVISFIC
jgi:hypothetical protein